VAIVSADVDRDGFADLVTANNESDNASIFFGSAGGFEEPPVNVPTLFGPVAAQVADMNGDGRPDLVVVHDIEEAVAVLLQGEARAFALGDGVGTAEFPVALVVGNLDSDQTLDVATANHLSGTVSILAGRGDGTFLGGGDIDVGGTESGPVALAAGGLNGDTSVDLAVANSGADSVVLLLRNANGYSLRGPFAVGRSPVSVTVADLDIDGRTDIVTANEDGSSVSVLFGDGTGGFGNRLDLTVGVFPEALAVWDLNLDGRPDIAVANTIGEGDAVSILRGTGGRLVQAPEDFLIGGPLPVSLTTRDLDGDRAGDVATANVDDASLALSVLLNEGTLIAGDSCPDGDLDAEDVRQVVAELFDGDGTTVAAVAGGAGGSGPGVDGNGDEGITSADILAVNAIVVAHPFTPAPPPDSTAVRGPPNPCTQTCAELAVGNAAASPGDQVRIPITFSQAPDDGLMGGPDDVAVLAFTLAIPGLSLDDCDNPTADGLTGAIEVPVVVAESFAVIIENTLCADRDHCLCPGQGQERDEFINVVISGQRVLGGPLDLQLLPTAELLALHLRIGETGSGAVPLHVFAATDPPLPPAAAPFGAAASVGDTAFQDVTVDRFANQSRLRTIDGVLSMATATPPPTPTSTASPAATPTPGGVCAGDCNDNGVVSALDLFIATCRNVACGGAPLGPCACNGQPVPACAKGDSTGNGVITALEVFQATQNSVDPAIRNECSGP
jgi:hypothetical protein